MTRDEHPIPTPRSDAVANKSANRIIEEARRIETELQSALAELDTITAKHKSRTLADTTSRLTLVTKLQRQLYKGYKAAQFALVRIARHDEATQTIRQMALAGESKAHELATAKASP